MSVTKLTLAVLAALCAGCADEGTKFDAIRHEPTCGMPFTEYDVGASFEGIDFEVRVTSCGWRPSVTYIYGTCHATSETGCSPPLEVQTWSACHRRPPRRPRPGDLEFQRGETTVVIFAHSRAMGRRAKAVVRKARRADPKLRATKKLRACGVR